MNLNLEISPSILTDRELVARHLDGDRVAFRHIVERHQAMVCALGFSACGDIARSEDIAQEVFVAAWKQLPELREPQKLRGWLAGIARNLINNSFRRAQHTPTARAEELSTNEPAGEDSPREQAINADEVSLMWNALEGIPETYREPMVLFYREQQSVSAVAGALEISEEAVRQRLVRGRAMLTERMAKLVEETLTRSAPTTAFAGTVLLALQIGGPPTVAKAAVMAISGGSGGVAFKTVSGATGIAAIAAKGGVAAKVLSVGGLLPFVLGGAVDFLKFRTNYEAQTSSNDRRRFVLRYFSPKLLWGLFFGGFFFLQLLRMPGWPLANRPTEYFILSIVALLVLTLSMSVYLRKWQSRLGAEAAAGEDGDRRTLFEKGYEYRSRKEFLGLPLVHLHLGGAGPVMKRIARGWIAVTDGIALGGLFGAGGQLAVAPVSIGPAAVGVLAVGCLSAGVWAAGLMACGIYAWGGGAFAWIAAKGGGIAVSKSYALGQDAYALHANNDVARLYFQNHPFFRIAENLVESVSWITLLVAGFSSVFFIGLYLWRKQAVR